MILYKKTTPDTPVANRIKFLEEKLAKSEERLACYLARQEDLEKHITFVQGCIDNILKEIKGLEPFIEA